MSSVIRCDASPQEVVAWKSPINEPSYGSQILVQETQIAILLESGKLVGKLDSGIYPIESPSLPFFKRLLPGGSAAFPYDIWFITSVTSTDCKWGTRNPIQVFDQNYKMMVPIGSFGSARLSIRDHESFFRQVVGTSDIYTRQDLKELVNPIIERFISQAIADKASQTDVFTISRETSNLSTSCKRECDFDFRRLGIDLDDFYVQGISVISDDPSFNKLKEALSEAATIRVKGDAIKDYKETYSLERSFDVLEKAAENDSGIAGAFVGAGIGLGSGLNLANNLNTGNNTNEPKSESKSPIEKLQDLKKLHELELITKDEYDAKRSEILKEL